MKKIMFIIICVFFLVPFGNAEARDCAYGMPSPPIYYNGNWAYGQISYLKTSASACRAENMSVYFDDAAGSYFANIGFTLDAYLMEHDEYPNDHDLAKLYYGTNTGYDLMQWGLIDKIEGNLDSEGDQTCELYMKFRLREPLAQNNVEYFPDDMFRYTVCVD